MMSITVGQISLTYLSRQPVHEHVGQTMIAAVPPYSAEKLISLPPL